MLAGPVGTVCWGRSLWIVWNSRALKDVPNTRSNSLARDSYLRWVLNMSVCRCQSKGATRHLTSVNLSHICMGRACVPVCQMQLARTSRVLWHAVDGIGQSNTYTDSNLLSFRPVNCKDKFWCRCKGRRILEQFFPPRFTSLSEFCSAKTVSLTQNIQKHSRPWPWGI